MRVDRSVPPPLPARRYPFDSLKPGESFLLEVPLGEVHAALQRLRSAAYARGRRTGETFTARVVHGGVRVWRIA